MSGFFIFEIKHTKMDKIFNFSKDGFSVISSPMDMIFDMFSETDVRLLKCIISQFFSKYSNFDINPFYSILQKFQRAIILWSLGPKS